MQDFLQESRERGFLYQATNLDGLTGLMAKKKIIGYIGFDATATSLQVGNLVAIMWLRLLQKHGHNPLVVIGGATSKIGDPSGKDESRKIMTEETLQNNINGIKNTFARFLNINQTIIVNNNDWLSNLNVIDFLRDIGRHFSVNRMLSFDNVKLRLSREQPLSFLEFNYMVFQAFDFLHLYKNYDCLLQMGGSDQWGNIVSGIDLVRKITQTEVFGLTAPLITNANGSKMGKTAQGAVWLNADQFSPYDYWQFWRNTHDADVIRYLKIFTDLPLAEINKLALLQGAELNDAKIILADQATTLAHGKEVLPSIHQAVAQLFAGGNNDTQTGIPAIELNLIGIESIYVDELLVTAGICSSKGEVKRLVQGDGLKINDQLIKDFKLSIPINTDSMKISVGKKRHFVIRCKL